MKKDKNNSAGSNDPAKRNVPAEIEKTKVHIIVEIIEYVPNSVYDE